MSLKRRYAAFRLLVLHAYYVENGFEHRPTDNELAEWAHARWRQLLLDVGARP